jgi:hypothetical protein
VPDKLELASIPTHEPSTQTVCFVFWAGNKKQAASVKLPSMNSDEAMRFFNTNWAVIAGMAARTAPMNGEVKLTLCS